MLNKINNVYLFGYFPTVGFGQILLEFAFLYPIFPYPTVNLYNICHSSEIMLQNLPFFVHFYENVLMILPVMISCSPHFTTPVLAIELEE